VVRIPISPAPRSIVNESREPEIRKAMTIPGKTACEIASPTIAIFLRIKKHPSNAHVVATRDAVKIIYRSFIRTNSKFQNPKSQISIPATKSLHSIYQVLPSQI
jgi:hypothetical protein